MSRRYQIERESDHVGWLSWGAPVDWWTALYWLHHGWTGRPMRLVEVDDAGEFVRVVTPAEIISERPVEGERSC